MHAEAHIVLDEYENTYQRIENEPTSQNLGTLALEPGRRREEIEAAPGAAG
ncbi:MAG TPA: hypothetical protein VFK66_05750 [Oryzihumus sp.]|nr:hypothetical protein [Oryzihumus sp.]